MDDMIELIDFPNVKKNSRIVVALSGGVDSSTTIALLKHNGYNNIIGMTLLLHENDIVKGIISKDQKVIEDCTKVVNHLNIEHKFIDIKAQFMQNIIEPFLKVIKMGLLLILV